MPNQAKPVPDPVPDPASVPGDAVEDSENSGSEDGSGSRSSDETGGNTSDENRAFIEDLEERAEYLDNEDAEAARLQAEMAELRERIAGHKSQLAQIRRRCGLLPWQRNPTTVIKIKTVWYGENRY